MSDRNWIKMSEYAESAGLERSHSILDVLPNERQAKYLQTMAPSPLLQVLIAFEMKQPVPAEIQQDFCNAMQEWLANKKTLENVFGIDGYLRKQLQESVNLQVANTLDTVLRLREELIEKNEYQQYVELIKTKETRKGQVFEDPVVRAIKMLEDATTKTKSKLKLETLVAALLDDQYGPGRWPTTPKSVVQRYRRWIGEPEKK